MTAFTSNLEKRVTQRHNHANRGYEEQQLFWTLEAGGHKYVLILNGMQKGVEGFNRTRFARKHLLLPSVRQGKETDVAKKLVNRFEHRSAGGDRYSYKYGGALNSLHAKNTVINLVDQQAERFVDEKTAAEKIVAGNWDFGDGKETQRVRVNFGCECVLVYGYSNALNLHTWKHSSCNLEGRALIKDGWRMIILEHLDTRGI